jgi:hypothetical protein
MLMRHRAWRMLKPLALALLIVAVGIGAIAIVQHYEPSKREAVQEANNQGEAKAVDILSSERVAYYTKVLAIFTAVLSAFGLLQIGFLIRSDNIARIAADAAKLNAEALIDADRAHLYAVIKSHNLGAALRAAHIVDMDDTPANPRPMIQFSLRNLGRAAAIMEEVGWLLTQRERGIRDWQYPTGAITEPVIIGGAETMPPTDCSLEPPVFSVRDAKSAFDGNRPVYFVGFVVFTTSMDRVYEFRWQYENAGTGWLLTHYDERERSKGAHYPWKPRR